MSRFRLVFAPSTLAFPLFVAALVLSLLASCAPSESVSPPVKREKIVSVGQALGGSPDHGFDHAAYLPAPGQHFVAVVTALQSNGHADLMYFMRDTTTDEIVVATASDVPHFHWPALHIAFPGAGPNVAFAIDSTDPNTWFNGLILQGAPSGSIRLALQDATWTTTAVSDWTDPGPIVHANPSAYFPAWILDSDWGRNPGTDDIVSAACAPPPADAGTD